MTQRPYTFASDRVDSAFVNMPDRVLFEINDLMRSSRQHHHEEVACFPARTDGREWWIGDLYLAIGVRRTFATMIDSFECSQGDGVVHTHWTASEGDCAVAGTDVAPAKASSGYPVWLVLCGYGMDSLIAYRVKPAPPPRTATRLPP